MTGLKDSDLVSRVLPTMISTAELYEKVFRPFKHYTQFFPKLELFQRQLRTQKTIVRNECTLLLATIIDRQTARTMLKEPKHCLWFDELLDKRLVTQLQDLGVPFHSTICRIRKKLDDLEGETINLPFAVDKLPVSDLQEVITTR